MILNSLLLVPTIAVFALYKPGKSSKGASRPSVPKEKEDEQLDPLPVRPFVTAYRGTMMIVTCIAILAVDFRVFPRRFAKVETWGTSVMDMGVGSFVFSAGLVSARPALQAKLTGKQSSITSLLLASPRFAVPLLVLGMIRLYSVKGLDYAEHVSEYGVHWNFFFTLALIPPLASFCQPFLDYVHPIVLTIILDGVYEIILASTNLKAFILTAPRIDLLSQNREGVFSLFGYLAIFLNGQGLGQQILARNSDGYFRMLLPPASKNEIFAHLTGNSILWWTAFQLCTSYRYGLGLQVSRRLANLSYVCWVAAFNCAQLLAFHIAEILCFPALLSAKSKAAERREIDRATSKILKAYNRNGLAIFLLANLLTGLVNLTVDTLSMDRIISMGILVAYCSAITAVAVSLDVCSISIKL